MLRKTLALAAVLLVGMAAPALAGDGYADEDAMVLSETTVAPGEDFTATVGVCEPATEADFTIDEEAAGTATAGDDGQASTTLTAPTEEGTHTVTGACTGPDGDAVVLSSTLTVGVAGEGLPSTGTNSSLPLSRVALGALLLGGLFVLIARRRTGADHETVGA
jgi:hypothetical protein